MSLDVYLILPGVPAVRPEGIWIRRDHEVFAANITHNMNRMAKEVGLYEPLWEAQDKGVAHAHELIEPLRVGLARLLAERERLQEFNPANGWGNYDLLVSFTQDYLEACERYPETEVRVSR